jgi:uncharacterized protein (TIGR03083 family)
MNDPSPSVGDWLQAASASHQRLATIVGSLSPEEIAGPSYATEWSVAQVLSHLGSGAQIFTLFLQAGLRGEPAPAPTEFQPIWERWNAKSAAEQAADALIADREFLQQLEAIEPDERQRWHLEMFGGDQGLSDLLRLRVGEHALHTWDVAVTRDPKATVADDATVLLIDGLDQLVARAGRPTEQPWRVLISTESPVRQFQLDADTEGMTLRAVARSGGSEGDRTLSLPAEALIRLIYGRLDPDHTPPLQADQADLDALRRLFPGF